MELTPLKSSSLFLFCKGFLSRADAEAILAMWGEGSFLVRVHDRIKGYVVSYKAPEKVGSTESPIKHILFVQLLPGNCRFGIVKFYNTIFHP